MGHSVYRNRIDTDFTVNKFETAHEVNVLLKPHINLQESTMLQPPWKTRPSGCRQFINMT